VDRPWSSWFVVRSSWWELRTLAVWLAFTGVAVVFTWPLARHAGSAFAGDPFGDALLNTWILAWDADRILHGFEQYWDGLFFYPYQGTVTYSEHLLGIAIFTAPIQWLSGNPVLAYNVGLIGSTVLAGVGAFLLARELTGRGDVAFAAALAFACSPYRFPQILHLQVMSAGWMPIALYALHRFFKTGSSKAAAGFAAAFALQALSNWYFLYFLAIPVAIVSLRGLWQRRRDWRIFLVRFAVAVVAAGTALFPVASAYLRVHHERGFVRSVGDARHFSADVTSRPMVRSAAACISGAVCCHPRLTSASCFLESRSRHSHSLVSRGPHGSGRQIQRPVGRCGCTSSF
jgi:hypothetical protein